MYDWGFDDIIVDIVQQEVLTVLQESTQMIFMKLLINAFVPSYITIFLHVYCTLETVVDLRDVKKLTGQTNQHLVCSLKRFDSTVVKGNWITPNRCDGIQVIANVWKINGDICHSIQSPINCD